MEPLTVASGSTDNNIYASHSQDVAASWRLPLHSSPKGAGFILSHISDRTPKIQIFANRTQVKVERNVQVGGGVRSKITGQSRASRKRMLEYYAQIRNFKKTAAITLTYPGEYSPNAERWKRDLFTLNKRLKRRYPNLFHIWKIEPQERGAPHFHLLACQYEGSLRNFRGWIKDWWYDIVGSGDMRHYGAGTQVDRMKNHKHSTWYLARYIAKREKAGYKFVTSDGKELKHIGRHWGVHNRAAADDAAYGTYTLTPYQLIELKRMVTRWLKSKGVAYGKRMSSRHPMLGWSVFGLGDHTLGLHRRTIFRMLLAVTESDTKCTTYSA